MNGRWSLYTEDGWVPVDLRLQVALPEWTHVQPLVWGGIHWLDLFPEEVVDRDAATA